MVVGGGQAEVEGGAMMQEQADRVGGINLWRLLPPNRIDPSRVFLAKLGLRTRKR